MSVRCSYGVRTVFVRCPYGVLTVFARCPCGVRTVFARCSRVVRALFVRCSCGRKSQLPSPAHSFTLGHPGVHLAAQGGAIRLPGVSKFHLNYIYTFLLVVRTVSVRCSYGVRTVSVRCSRVVRTVFARCSRVVRALFARCSRVVRALFVYSVTVRE